MTSLQDIINLAKADGGKFFVIDESGEPKLVIMSVEDYQLLLLGKIKRQVEDVEKINREILQAQVQEEKIEPVVEIPKPKFQGPTVQQSLAQNGAGQHQPIPRQDLRSEVIDPSFDFEGPKIELDDL
jgi:hypothetical protein